MPEQNAPWPPRGLAQAYRDFDTWDAWYSGDQDRLYDVYRPRDANERRDDRFRDRMRRSDGVIGQAARWFMGTPPRDGERVNRLHVPAAGDLATTWADMLFAQAPRVRSDNRDTRARLDDLFDEDTWVQLHEAAMVQGALGGVYCTASFDRTADESRPLVYVNHPDSAVPRFAGRRLAEVTFHSVVDERDGDVLRHLEHHETGRVRHGLFWGRRDNLGRRVPLTEAGDQLAHLIDDLDDDGESIVTGLPRVDTVYVKFRPTKKWRRNGDLRRHGASLYAGVESLMDALNESYSSWMRDLRLAKARIIAPQHYLDNHGPGQGASFDTEREVWAPVNAMGGKDSTGITLAQFDIRMAQHQGTTQALWQEVVSGAGFAAQTFGLTGEAAMTAAESWARERKTHYTRGGGTRHWTLGIRDLAELLLLLDRAEFGSTVPVEEATVEFPPLVADQPRERAETTRLMLDAEASTVETRVRVLHPDWEDDQVRAEVNEIKGDQQAARDAVPDPLGDAEDALNRMRGGDPDDDQADDDEQE